ncbi:MAG: thioredoxin [Eubacteriales bacterium]|nr:thioredoxin [Eubacteriales bacterium]
MKITAENFKREAEDNRGLTVIDFYADWCGPCRMLSPIVEEMAERFPDVKFGKVNVDEEGELAARFGVVSIPTLVFMKGGKILETSVGYMGPDALEAKIRNHE